MSRCLGIATAFFYFAVYLLHELTPDSFPNFSPREMVSCFADHAPDLLIFCTGKLGLAGLRLGRSNCQKGGHLLGYALLALSYWWALDLQQDHRWLAWLFAVLYAATDEFHQSFTSGRHPSVWDILIFDNLGALIALWLSNLFIKRKQPDGGNLVVEKLDR